MEKVTLKEAISAYLNGATAYVANMQEISAFNLDELKAGSESKAMVFLIEKEEKQDSISVKETIRAEIAEVRKPIAINGREFVQMYVDEEYPLSQIADYFGITTEQATIWASGHIDQISKRRKTLEGAAESAKQM